MKTLLENRKLAAGLAFVLLALILAVVIANSDSSELEVDPGSQPVAEDDVAMLPGIDSPVSVDVAANDVDDDGDLDRLSVSIVRPPQWGSARVGLDGLVEYSPSAAWSGRDSLDYEVCDSALSCDRATLTISDRPLTLSGEAVRFAVFGDYGDHSNGAAAVAEQVAGLAPDFIVTTGDNSYDTPDYEANVGQFYSDYIGSYTGEHGPGSPTNRFFPALGDHEYSDGGVEHYLDYFTLPGAGITSSMTSGNERYYDFVMGPVHLFMLNLQPQEPDGMGSRSVQAEWLQSQLADSTSPWRMVITSRPPFSSGDNHGSDPEVQWPYEEWGADAVFSGDDHVYERIIHDGFPYFVSGLGGRSMYGFDVPVEGSEHRYNADFGVLVVTACDTRVEFEFHSLSEGVIDGYALGNEACPLQATESGRS